MRVAPHLRGGGCLIIATVAVSRRSSVFSKVTGQANAAPMEWQRPMSTIFASRKFAGVSAGHPGKCRLGFKAHRNGAVDVAG
jgi:hypothetical protein